MPEDLEEPGIHESLKSEPLKIPVDGDAIQRLKSYTTDLEKLKKESESLLRQKSKVNDPFARGEISAFQESLMEKMNFYPNLILLLRKGEEVRLVLDEPKEPLRNPRVKVEGKLLSLAQGDLSRLLDIVCLPETWREKNELQISTGNALTEGRGIILSPPQEQ